jgi:replicative DNA helicase
VVLKKEAKGIPMTKEDVFQLEPEALKKALNDALYYDTMTSVDELTEQGDGLSIGFPDMEKYLDSGGFQPGQTITLISKPKVGKTFFVGNAIYHLMKQSVPTMFVSIEMNARAIIKRMLRLEMGVGYDDLRQIVSTDAGLTFIEGVVDRWFNSLSLIDMRAIDPDTIEEFVHKLRPKVMFIDFLQIVNQRGDSEMEKVSTIMKRLTDITQRYGVITFVLSQTAKDEIPGWKMPLSSSGKWSSDIHILSDILIGMCRKDINPDVAACERYIVELQILESRYGGSSPAIVYHYDPLTTMYTEVNQWDKQRLG